MTSTPCVSTGRSIDPVRYTMLGEHHIALVDETLLGLGEGVTKVERKQYDAYQRLRNFACVTPRQESPALAL